MAQKPTVDDPVFGKITYDNGWCGTFADPRFASWGQTVLRYHVPFQEQDDEPSRRLEAEKAVEQLRAAVPPEMQEQSQLFKAMMENLPKIAEHDASLDSDHLL